MGSTGRAIVTLFMNRRMWALLGASARSTATLESRVRELLASPIVDYEGCLVLSELLGARPAERRAHYDDDVAFEASVNDVDLTDRERSGDPVRLAAVALEGFELLRGNLASIEAEGVRIIVGVNLGPDHPSATIRFHRLRDDVASWVDTDRLEDFLSDGVLVEDI